MTIPTSYAIVILIAYTWIIYRLGKRAQRKASQATIATFRQMRYIDSLCEEMSIEAPVIPPSKAEASRLITDLLEKRNDLTTSDLIAGN